MGIYTIETLSASLALEVSLSSIVRDVFWSLLNFSKRRDAIPADLLECYRIQALFKGGKVNIG